MGLVTEAGEEMFRPGRHEDAYECLLAICTRINYWFPVNKFLSKAFSFKGRSVINCIDCLDALVRKEEEFMVIHFQFCVMRYNDDIAVFNS